MTLRPMIRGCLFDARVDPLPLLELLFVGNQPKWHRVQPNELGSFVDPGNARSFGVLRTRRWIGFAQDQDALDPRHHSYFPSSFGSTGAFGNGTERQSVF